MWRCQNSLMYLTEGKFKKDMDEVYQFIREAMEEQRLFYQDDFGRHVTSLAEDFQARLKTAGDKMDMIWDKCDKRCAELENNII